MTCSLKLVNLITGQYHGSVSISDPLGSWILSYMTHVTHPGLLTVTR